MEDRGWLCRYIREAILHPPSSILIFSESPCQEHVRGPNRCCDVFRNMIGVRLSICGESGILLFLAMSIQKQLRSLGLPTRIEWLCPAALTPLPPTPGSAG